MKTAIRTVISLSALLLYCIVFAAAPVTNSDIEKLLAAGIGDDVILNVIAAGKPQFDTSPDALIALKQKGASQAVLAAITGKPAPTNAVPPKKEIQPAADAMNALVEQFDVIVLDNEKQVTMVYNQPEIREAGRILSALGGLGQLANRAYWVLTGPKAQFRLQSRQPLFLVSVPRNSRPEQSVRLTLWAARPNKTREIMIDRARWTPGDSVTSQSGPQFPADRTIQVAFAPAKAGPSGLSRFEVRPKEALKPGEYALVIGAQIYDFGVDPES